MIESSARRDDDGLTPRQIFGRLDQYVIGQDEAKRAVAIAAYNHLKRIEARRFGRGTLVKKSNILLIGPTGSGKTHIARNLASILSVPFTTVDATEYTEAGYYGKDVEVMIADLLAKANQVVEEAQRGIIFIDEVDKIARRTQGAKNGAGSRDIGGEGVQQALLKLLEGREVSVPVTPSQSWSRHDYVTVDTKDILFICAGTFSDLHDYGSDTRRAIGFSDDGLTAKKRRKSINMKQLTDFGMLAEFMGRLPVVVQLDKLTPPDLKRVLTEPPDAITKEFRELLALDEIDLKFTDAALDQVVRYSVDKNLGARGLRSIIEQVMSEILFEAPEQRRRAVTVDEPLVKRRLLSLDSP